MGINAVARRSRYPSGHRALRMILSGRSFGAFLAPYLVIDLAVLNVEGWLGTMRSEITTVSPSATRVMRQMIDTVPSWLLGAQIGLLSVISLALALVTLIAQRDDATTDVKVYYHESLFLEITASGLALAAVLCVQFVWPAQAVFHALGGVLTTPIFKAGLLAVHVAWMLVNIAATAHFIAVTFGFVQRGARERMRERYTANVVVPRELTRRVRHHLHLTAGMTTGQNGRPGMTFGYGTGIASAPEIESDFTDGTCLLDVRLALAKWVLARWTARCSQTGTSSTATTLGSGPRLWFVLRLDEPVRGPTVWCRRSGGVPLTRGEKLVLKWAFHFGERRMDDDLPSSDQIIEELAERAAIQIERRAPVAFDGALGELIRYNRFLIDIYAATNDDARPFSYSEVAGSEWHPPYRDWLRQYRRLFNLAVDRLPDNGSFLEKLAYVPRRLMGGNADVPLSTALIEGILDLGPSLVHAVESWITRRSLATTSGAAEDAHGTLAGSDAKALADAMPNVVGAWESLIEMTSHAFSWQPSVPLQAGEQWNRYASSWPFMRQHLADTAYSLATAVWNGDAVGARLFREALVRWPGSGMLHVRDDGYHSHPWLMLPDSMAKPWSEVESRVAQLDQGFSHDASPDSVFNELVAGVRGDVILMTASMLTLWGAGGGRSATLASAMAGELLAGIGADELGTRRAAFDMRTAMIGMVRLQLAGERFESGTHGAWLDRALQHMDRMREGKVVPGRIFSPTTMSDRDDLLVGDAAMLTALAIGAEGTAAAEIAALAAEEHLPPDGDASLRAVLDQFRRIRKVVGSGDPRFGDAVANLAPEIRSADAAGALTRELDVCVLAIEKARASRLRSKAVDPAALNDLRVAIEADLTKSPASVAFFVDVECYAAGDGGEQRTLQFGEIPKARLVRPEMEPPISNWRETVSTAVRTEAGRVAFRSFVGRVRERIEVDSLLQTRSFWQSIAPLIARVGPQPVLVVNIEDAQRGLQAYGSRHVVGPPEVIVVGGRRPRERGRFIGVVEGVEVFATDVPAGVAWLFSATQLRSMGFGAAAGHRVDLTWEPEDDDPLSGPLTVNFRQILVWSDHPVFEIRGPEAQDTAPD